MILFTNLKQPHTVYSTHCGFRFTPKEACGSSLIHLKYIFKIAGRPGVVLSPCWFQNPEKDSKGDWRGMNPTTQPSQSSIHYRCSTLTLKGKYTLTRMTKDPDRLEKLHFPRVLILLDISCTSPSLQDPQRIMKWLSFLD